MSRALLALIAALAVSTASYAQSCLIEGTVFGKPIRECLTNVSLAKEAFDSLCTAWEKNPIPQIQMKTTYGDSCPEDYAGYCVTTFAVSGQSMKHYFYKAEMVNRYKKGCTPTGSPIASGVWHDR